MNAPSRSQDHGYDSSYGDFDSPLLRRIRAQAHGEDIGQHSWVTAGELRDDVARLGLSRTSCVLDLGCGPCGPLTFVLALVGCHGTGLDASAPALEAGRARAAVLAVDSRIDVQVADLDEPLPVPDGAFDAAWSFDVVLHLKDRAALFREVVRILVPGGRFLFTDAGVVTGAISYDEVRRRSIHEFTQFCAPGFNERLLEAAGLRVLEIRDRTESVLAIAQGRRDARLAHREALVMLEGVDEFERQQQYLDVVLALAERGALARTLYLAESPAT